MTKHHSENHPGNLRSKLANFHGKQLKLCQFLTSHGDNGDGESTANAMEQGTLKAMLLQMIEIERYHELGRVYCGYTKDIASDIASDPK